MKKMTILITFLGLNLVAFGNVVEPEVRIATVADTKKFSLELSNIEPGATTVTLYDVNGLALLNEKIGKKHYGKVFNLANLPTGSYDLVIETGNRDIIQPLELTFKGVDMDASLRTVYFAPVIRNNETSLDVTFFRGKMADVSVSIYQDNELVFKEDFDNVIKVERRYDLSSLPKGSYNVMINTDYKTYYKELIVQ